MISSFEDFQKYGQENVDLAVKAFGAASKSAQAIATEMSDYSKKAIDDGTQAFEKVLGSKSPEAAFETQQSYLKGAYEGFVSEATKLGELYTNLAKEAYKPYESFFAKVMPK